MSNEDKINFLWDVIKRYDGYIGTANYKASLLLSFCSAISISVILKTKPLIEKLDIECFQAAAILLIICILILSGTAIFHLLKAVFPQTISYTAGQSLVFFGDVSKNEGLANGYHHKVLKLTEDTVVKDLSYQAYELSLITTNKFEDIKKAVNIIKFFLLAPSFLFMILIAIF